MNLAKLDLRPKPSSPIFLQLPGFHEIPMDRIGLYRDAFRLTLPSAEETGRNSDRTTSLPFDSNIDVKASDRIATPKP